MKVKEGFMVRKLGDQYVVVALGKAADTFQGMIRLNRAGAFLWRQLAGRSVSKEQLVNAMLHKYAVDRATAGSDVDAFLAKLNEASLLEA